jgi:hypothetical protein
MGVKQGHAPEQAALGTARGVCITVGDAQWREWPAPDAGSPREGRPSTVCSALNGNQRPTLMRPLIAIRTPFGSTAPSLIAWAK